MSKQYSPNTPFTVPVQLLKRNVEKINGVNAEKYTEAETILCSCVSWGGTDTTVNGVFAVVDTMTFESWYNPNFDTGDRVKILDDNSVYTILASPENINRRGQYMKFRGERVRG